MATVWLAFADQTICSFRGEEGWRVNKGKKTLYKQLAFKRKRLFGKTNGGQVAGFHGSGESQVFKGNWGEFALGGRVDQSEEWPSGKRIPHTENGIRWCTGSVFVTLSCWVFSQTPPLFSHSTCFPSSSSSALLPCAKVCRCRGLFVLLLSLMA